VCGVNCTASKRGGREEENERKRLQIEIFGFGRINFNNSELNYWELKHRAEKETKYNN
jgi:hypothetical protein